MSVKDREMGWKAMEGDAVRWEEWKSGYSATVYLGKSVNPSAWLG